MAVVPFKQPVKSWTAFTNAVATVAAAPLNVLVVGDSVSERLHANTRQLAWPSRMLAGLRSVIQPSGVPGGQGFIPAWNIDVALGLTGLPPGASQQTWLPGGSGTVAAAGASIGIGCRAALLAVGASQTVALPSNNTGADLWWYRAVGAGTLTWLVTFTDGTTTTGSFSTAGTAGGGNVTRISTLSGLKVPRSLTVTASAASVTFEGGALFAGDETKGVRLYEGGHTGAQVGTFPGATPWLTSVNTLQPQAVVIELGINDWNAGTTAATYQTGIANLVTAIRAQCTIAPSVLLLGYWQPVQSLGETSTWAQFMAALANAAAATTDCQVLDLYNLFGQYVIAPITRDVYRFADTVHPSDFGHQSIGTMVASSFVAY